MTSKQRDAIDFIGVSLPEGWQADLGFMISLQHGWSMTEPQIFGPRLGSDAICLRADLTTGSALANLRALLVSSASMLSMLADNSAECDPTKHVASAVKESLREGLGMLGVVERAVDEDPRKVVT